MMMMMNWTLVLSCSVPKHVHIICARDAGKREKKNELELSFEGDERLCVLKSRREVVPEHWSSRPAGARVSCRYWH